MSMNAALPFATSLEALARSAWAARPSAVGARWSLHGRRSARSVGAGCPSFGGQRTDSGCSTGRVREASTRRQPHLGAAVVTRSQLGRLSVRRERVGRVRQAHHEHFKRLGFSSFERCWLLRRGQVRLAATAPVLPHLPSPLAPSSEWPAKPCVHSLMHNPSIERTSSSKLRLLPAAAHVER